MSNRRKLQRGKNYGSVPPAALTIVGGDSQSGTNTMTHNLTGVPAGALIVITTTSNQTGTNATVGSTPALTFTKQVDAVTPQSPGAEIYTAVYGGGGSLTITVGWGAGATQTSRAYVVTGQEPVLGGAAATGLGQGTANVPITTTKANSIVFCTSSNWNAPTLPVTYRGTPTEAFSFRDAAQGTALHYFYNVPVVGPFLGPAPNGVGYSAPNDIDLGTSTAVLEIRSASGVAGNSAPIANAGANQTIVSPASSVNVSGNLSSDDVGITSYAWARVSGPNTPTITSPNTSSTSITGLIVGVYVFRLTVTDGGGLSNTDDIQITVSSSNTAPIANAGVNQTITLPTNSVTLDSSASTDDVGITSRTWTRTSGPNTPTIVTPNGVTTNVTGLIAGIYIFRITVSDGSLTDFDEVQITVNSAGNSAPSAPILSSPGHSQTTVDLAWTAATDDVAVANYRLYRNNVLTNTLSAATLSITVTGLTNATSYTFRVEAVDTPGLFTPSNDVNVTTGVPPTPFTFTALSGDYRRYWGGPEFWGGGNGNLDIAFTHAHRYRRFVWNDWEGNTQGAYRFTENFGNGLKTFLDACASAKQLGSFGIMTCFPGQGAGDSFHTYNSFNGVGSAYPTYLHNLMQGEGIQDWQNGDCWVPNFNSPSYIGRFGAMMVALNAFLNTTHASGFKYWDIVGYIDLRGMGAYGEWHSAGIVADDVNEYPGFTWNTSGGQKNITAYGAFPTPASLISIIDHQRNNLGNVPLTTILNSLDGNFPNGGTGQFSGYFGTGFINTAIPVSVGQYIMNNGNAWGPIGRRRDQWGDTNNYYRVVAEQTNAITGIPTRWQTAPINGEPPGYVARDSRGIHMGALDPNGNSGDGEQEVVRQHPSIVGNSNYGNGGNIDIDTFESGAGQLPMRRAFTAMGCILRLVTGGGFTSTATQMSITTHWRNFGVAPQYKKNWQVTFELRSGGNLQWSGVSSLNLYSNAGLKNDTGSPVIITDTFTKPSLSPGTYELSVRILDPANYLEPLQLGINGRQEPRGAYILSNVTF